MEIHQKSKPLFFPYPCPVFYLVNPWSIVKIPEYGKIFRQKNMGLYKLGGNLTKMKPFLLDLAKIGHFLSIHDEMTH